MDARLVGWARAVKSRRRWGAERNAPVLWLFTDPARGGDPVASVRRLPAGLCGVVFRHDEVFGRAELLRAVWRACRRGRVWMVVAGEPAGFRGPGTHLRGGRGRPRHCAATHTASAHDMAELVRARRGGAAAVFLSPTFATSSHLGASGLGPVRWAGMARRAGLRSGGVLALGGVDGRTVRRLPRWCGGAGGIGALRDG